MKAVLCRSEKCLRQENEIFSEKLKIKKKSFGFYRKKKKERFMHDLQAKCSNHFRTKLQAFDLTLESRSLQRKLSQSWGEKSSVLMAVTTTLC